MNRAEPLRHFLQHEFVQRVRKNPSYSLRAYAQFLGVNQSFLSKVLNGQRRVTPKMAERLGPKIGTRLKPAQRMDSAIFSRLQDDEFEFLSQWHHFAILELAKLKKFNPDPLKIAQRMGLHLEEARSAIERLERMKLIQVKGKKWRLLSPDNTWSNTSLSSEARRRLQKELLLKAVDAIDQIPFTERENGSLTVAIKKKRMPEFKEKLKQVRAELADFFQPIGVDDLDEVYQLTLALFPVSRSKSSENRHG